MRILFICNKSPWPPREGGPIAMNAMIEGFLEQGNQVKVLAINSNKYNVDINTIPEVYRSKTKIELVYTDLRIKPLDAFFNLFTARSYHVKRFITKDLAKTIKRILTESQFDIIQLETLFVTPYISLIRQLSKAPIVLRAHNIEHLIWERLFQREKNLLKRFYLKHLYETLKNYEIKMIREVDGIIAITSTDASFFSHFISSEKIIAIPFGINDDMLNSVEKRPLAEPSNCIFHIGSMNWLPNVEGINWFLKEVWPDLKEKTPGIKFRIAGREMPEWLTHFNDPDVVVDGEVADAIDYMRKYRIMVVPLFSGSGIRIKIIEGMMTGCVVLTTTIGAEGIEYSNGQNILICNTKSDFIDSISMILKNESMVESLSKAASEFIRKNHSNSLLIRELESFYNRIIN